MIQAPMIAGPRMARSVQPAHRGAAQIIGRRAVLVRSQDPSTAAPEPAPEAAAPVLARPTSRAPRAPEPETSPAGTLTILGGMQEAINGRAAMLGFVAAVLSESSTHTAVWTQLAGRYTADGELLQAPIGTASLLFGATVAVVTVASLMPKMIEGLDVDGRSFGPFTPGVEKLVGRVAQMGFAGLLVAEVVRGAALLG